MRRMFRRDKRKAFTPHVPPILQEANLAFDKGEFGRAADKYEQIAHVADDRGGPRAPLFYLQAGRSRVLAGQTALGIPSLKRGLEIFAERKQFQRLDHFGSRTVHELYDHGCSNEASELETWIKSVLPEPLMVTNPVKQPMLPMHCPSCGAPVRPDEVEWLDESTAECGYCGSPVRE